MFKMRTISGQRIRQDADIGPSGSLRTSLRN
jgi:hypothetical protein